MNLQEANFEDLLVSYYKKSPAIAAAKCIGSEGREWNYQPSPTEFDPPFRRGSRETKSIASGLRDLFRCYCVIEIAALAGIVADPDNSPFWQETKVVLDSTFAARYLREWLDLPLIRLLKSRLNGVRISLHKESDEITDSVMAFLDLDRRYRLAKGDVHFALMSTGISKYGPQPLSALVKACSNPQVFVEHLLCPPDEREKGGEAVHGVSWLFGFCLELDELLKQLTAVPVLQAAIWSRYEYWLGNKPSQLRSNALLIHSLFETWQETQDSKAQEEIESYTDRSRRAIDAVTSDEYALLLDRVAVNATKLSEQAAMEGSVTLDLREQVAGFGLADENWKLQAESQDQILGADA